jgi:hypothetical protein
MEETTWQGCTRFNFKHVTTSSTPYYGLSHMLVKNMLIQMWSKCEFRGIREKLSPSCQQLKVDWFTNDSFIKLPKQFHRLHMLRLTHEDTHMKTHTILIAYHHYKRMRFFSHTKSVAAHDTWEVNFVVSSIITMYNMWCLLWRILH